MKTHDPKFPHLSVENKIPFTGWLTINYSSLAGLSVTRKEAKALRRLLKTALKFTKPEKS